MCSASARPRSSPTPGTCTRRVCNGLVCQDDGLAVHPDVAGNYAEASTLREASTSDFISMSAARRSRPTPPTIDIVNPSDCRRRHPAHRVQDPRRDDGERRGRPDRRGRPEVWIQRNLPAIPGGRRPGQSTPTSGTTSTCCEADRRRRSAASPTSCRRASLDRSRPTLSSRMLTGDAGHHRGRVGRRLLLADHNLRSGTCSSTTCATSWRGRSPCPKTQRRTTGFVTLHWNWPPAWATPRTSTCSRPTPPLPRLHAGLGRHQLPLRRGARAGARGGTDQGLQETGTTWRSWLTAA
jgi:hypothetical protein